MIQKNLGVSIAMFDSFLEGKLAIPLVDDTVDKNYTNQFTARYIQNSLGSCLKQWMCPTMYIMYI